MAANIYALICTRSKDISKTTDDLIKFYQSCGIKVKLIVGAKSIFEGYNNAFEKCPGDPDDIFIMGHDDLKILMQPKDFLYVLKESHKNKVTGFVGVAGTTHLSDNAVWWDHELWKQGKHSGFIFHGTDLYAMTPTNYGPCRKVTVLDGVFLTIRRESLEFIDLEKPNIFKGDWDFYDLYYTHQAYSMGYHNFTAPFVMLHASGGEINDRTSWQENRLAFIEMLQGKFPIKI